MLVTPPRPAARLCALSMMVWLAACALPADGQELPEARIREVEAMLAPQPTAFGRPISDRAAWQALATHPAWDGVVPQAERLLDQPVPEMTDELFLEFSQTGNRTHWEHAAYRRRGRIRPLVLAECLEDRGRFLPALEETIRALCAERTWVMPAHDTSLDDFYGRTVTVDLASSALAWELATVDYLLGERLDFRVRQLLQDSVRQRVLSPFSDMVLGTVRPIWWMRTTNNWNAVCLAGVTGAALALLESRQERAFFVVAAEEYSRYFLRGFTPDGYCSEGVGYWNYGFGNYVLLSEAIRQATGGGIDLLARPEARAPAAYGARIQILGGICPAFADCPVSTRPSDRVLCFVSRRLGLGLKEYDGFDPSSPGGALFEALMYSFPNAASEAAPARQPIEGLGLRSWFPDAGILIGRPDSAGSARLGVALKGGHNAENHNHNDVGSYVVVAAGQTVLADPGSEVYTARTFSSRRYESKVLNSWGHPVPIAAGRLQKTGAEAAAGVLKAEFTPEQDVLALDLKPAYEAPELVRLERTFVYSRAGAGALTVRDEVEFSQPAAFGTALLTLGRWKQTGPRSLLVYDTLSAVQVDIAVQGAPWAVKAEQIDEDVFTPGQPTRIGIDLAEPVTRAAVELTIRPVGQEGPALANGGFEEGEWAWLVPTDGMASVSTEAAAAGGASLHIVDVSTTDGSNVSSARIRSGGPGTYELRGRVLPVSGEGLGVYVRMLAADGRELNEVVDPRGWVSPVTVLGGGPGQWEPFAARFDAPEGTTYFVLWLHSFNAARVEAYLDDLEIVRLAD
jgi:hypothetical protein